MNKQGHGETGRRHSLANRTSTVHFFLTTSICEGRLLPQSNHNLEQKKGLPQHRSTLVAVVIVMSWPFVSVASAAPFQFLFHGEGSGTVDSTPFSGPFTIELLADTNDVELFLAAIGNVYHVDGDATISLPIGEGVFLEATGLRSDERSPNSFMPSVGFMAGGDLLHAESESFAEYRIDGPLGPITTSVVWLAAANPSAELDIGVLQFESVSEVTFTAALVPEPSTALLLGLGLIGFVVRLRPCT